MRGCAKNRDGYDVANEIINNKQHALTWHACDVKSTHVSPKANDELAIWCKEKHGRDDLVHIEAIRGKSHDYLGMNLCCSKKKEVLIGMMEHADQMKEHFPDKLEIETKAWSDKFFSADKKSKSSCEEKSDAFHSFSMKIMFLCKRGRPDVE